jgi:hypothetical protein
MSGQLKWRRARWEPTINQRLWRDEGLRVPQRRRPKRLGASTAGTVPCP